MEKSRNGGKSGQERGEIKERGRGNRFPTEGFKERKKQCAKPQKHQLFPLRFKLQQSVKAG